MAYDNRDPAYVPSQQALAADAYIASTSPETHPDEYTYYPMYGYTYTGPMAHYTSGTEYATWINSSLGDSMFGSGQQVADSQNNNPYIQSINTQALLDAFPDAQDTATYLSETNFPDLNPNQVGTVNPIGPAPESSSSGITNINTNPVPVDAVVPLPPPPPPATTTATTSTIPLAGFPQFEEPAQTQTQTGGGLTPEVLAALINALKPPPPPPPPPPKTGVAVGSSGGTFSPFQVQGMGYSGGNLSNISNSQNKVDYVSSLREGLSNSLFKGLL